MMKKSKWSDLLLSIITLCALMPIFWLITKGFTVCMTDCEQLFLQDSPFWKAYGNSVKVCIAVLCGQFAISFLSGWGIAQYSFCGRRVLLFGCIVFSLIPSQALLLPQYMALQELGLLDSLWSLILPNLFSPLGTLIFWHAASGIPKDVVAAAKVDGIGLWQQLRFIALPFCRKHIAVFLLISFAEQWNLLEQPMAFLKSSEYYPLAIYLSSAGISEKVYLPVYCTLTLIPVLLFFAAVLFIMRSD